MNKNEWEKILLEEKNILISSGFVGIIIISACLYAATLLDFNWAILFLGAVISVMYGDITLMKRKIYLLRVKEGFLERIYKRDMNKDISSEEKDHLNKLTEREKMDESKPKEKKSEK